MTGKINLNFMFVTAISILLTLFLTTIVSYQMFQKEVFSDLSSMAKLIERLNLMAQMKEHGFLEPQSELRITWIASDGSVLYDSYTDDAILGNHGTRPEILQAKQQGEGFCIRKSQTMEQSIFFYALKSADGNMIRIAKETGSLWQIYRNALPVTFFISILSFLVSICIARRLTRAFVRPIERMADNMDHMENITTYKELTPFIELIRSQHEETLKNAQIRQEFTANVSHELKTPLTSISGYSELIASGMTSPLEGQHFAEEIHRNANRLLSLINDILQLSELDGFTGHNFSFAPVDIYELASYCVEMLEPMASEHGVTLSLEGAPLKIRANRQLVEELLYNLCDNGIRYNKPGGHVWITVNHYLTVRDNGIGIPKIHQERVFERFFRVDKSRSKKTGGTGLGLAIVKHIAEIHNASLSLESKEGIGTAICVKFPDISSTVDFPAQPALQNPPAADM